MVVLRLISLLIIGLIIIPVALSYEYKENGNRMYVDFTSGGIAENQNGYNSSIVIGGSQVPFNSTVNGYEVKQGLYYSLLLKYSLADVGAILDFIFNIKDYGIEWVTLNWTG